MKKLYDEIEDDICGLYNYTFEPTINLFKNAVVFNYKKVGTRFFREIVSYPHNINKQNKQLDLSFRPHQFNELLNDVNKIQYKSKTLYVYTSLDNENNSNDIKFSYNNILNQSDFLKYFGFNSFNNLILNNTNDVIFVIKNPLKRFFSGLSQIIISFKEKIKYDIEEIMLLKNITNISDYQLGIFLKDFNLTKNDLFDKTGKYDDQVITSYITIMMYILQYRWEFILQDIHTDNYLKNYQELIDNISDNSKIKIIDLDDCKSKSALKFFSNLRGDDLLENVWDEFIENKIESNSFIYDEIFNNIEHKNKIINSALPHYLKNEQLAYLQLKESKYFVKI